MYTTGAACRKPIIWTRDPVRAAVSGLCFFVNIPGRERVVISVSETQRHRAMIGQFDRVSRAVCCVAIRSPQGRRGMHQRPNALQGTTCSKLLSGAEISFHDIIIITYLVPLPPYIAPSSSSASRSSRTAVGTSSKLSAEMAHLACFCALTIAASSTVALPG